MNRLKNSGQLVKTKDGKIGRTYHKDSYMEGKIKVYLEGEKRFVFDGMKILCDPKSLKVIGMID